MELEELDRKMRKLLTMYGAHHPKVDVDRLYMKRADGGRGLIGVEDFVRMEIDSLEKQLSTSNEQVLKEVSQSETIENKQNRKSKEDVKKEHTEKYEGKGLHGQCRKATENFKGEGSWDWLRKCYLKKETESTIIAAQDQALCTRNTRKNVYGEDIDYKCRVCGTADEAVAHIVSECPKLSQTDFKKIWHGNVTRVTHWKLYEKWGFDRGGKRYTHTPEKVLESEECKILRDFPMQTDKSLEHNRPDITVVDKQTKNAYLLICRTNLILE